MNAVPVITLGSCLMLAACGGGGRPLAQDAGGRYQLVARFDGDATGGEACRALVQSLGDRALVFAQDVAAAQKLTGPSGAAPERARLVTIADETAEAKPDERHALVVAPTGAATAVDIALLWCHGVAPPHRLALGPRVRLPDGTTTTQPSPSDFVVKMLRLEHAELLSTTPATDVVFRVGLVTLHDAGLGRLLREQAAAAGRRYPQLVLSVRHAGGDGAALEAVAREFLAEGARAILVHTDDAAPLHPIAAAAAERNVALIVLDPAADCELGTCCIGADQYTLGRAAGEAAKALAPGGAQLIELAIDQRTERAQLRDRGFGDALGLQAQ